jgi:L-threonylcarbamoyladenylate synthase
MMTLTISPDRPDPRVIGEAVALLRDGGVLAYATDTLYGLAVDPRREDAVDRLFALKGRDERAPIPLIAADLAQAQSIGEFGERERRLAEDFWPGPLTIAVPARPGLAARVLAGGPTIAVRVPAHKVACSLARVLGSPITATSANLSGQPAPSTPSQLDPALLARIDAVLDSGPAPGGAPSTIVAAARDGFRLLRAGAIAWDRVLRSATGHNGTERRTQTDERADDG